MEDLISQTAQKYFGISYLFPIQRLIITNILEAAKNTESHNRQLILLPTGAGKSLCFQIPALLLPGHTLIIYPILGLMSDQQRRMQESGIDCVVLRGGQTAQERRAMYQRMQTTPPQVIISNPETIALPAVQAQLASCPLVHLVIDEAHCIHEWGLQFRPAFLELGKCIEALQIPVVTAFTATASANIIKTIQRVLFPQTSCHIIRGNPDRPNIYYRTVNTLSPIATLLAALQHQRITRPCLVFGNTRKTVSAAAHFLRHYQFPVRFYHAGLDRKEREEVEKWFFTSTDGILCATCAYGMGIDKTNIRSVVHLTAPASAEAYLQEAGRAGRDRNRAEATLLLLPGTAVFANYAQNQECRRQQLLSAMGDQGDFCDSCEICCKEENPWEDFTIALTWVTRHPRRFSPLQLAHRLLERFPAIPLDVLSESVSAAISGKLMHLIAAGPWKGTLKKQRSGVLIDKESIFT